MIVKPAIHWINRNRDPLFINNVSVVLNAMGNNTAIYDNPSPPLAVVQAALDDFSAGLVATADGGKSVTSRKKQLRLVLAGLMRQLAAYVVVACKGDMTNLLLSGFPIHKPVRQPVGNPPTPGNLLLKHGVHSGDLLARANPVFGAVFYHWILTSNAPGAVPQTAETTAAKTTFTGLIPGLIYTVRLNATGTAGSSDWSQPARLMVV